MPQAPLSDEKALEAADALKKHGRIYLAAESLGLNEKTFRHRLKIATQRGLGDYQPGPPGIAPGQILAGTSTLYKFPDDDPEGRLLQWVKAKEDANTTLEAIRVAVDELKQELPREAPTPVPPLGNADLLNQYTVTDLHFGMLSWKDETGADYDLKIAEKLLLDWFAAAIAMSPPAQTAILAQLGDLLHHDSHSSVTPTSHHVLDADSRFPKIVRVVIRTLRRVIRMLLEKHQHVHIIMADANHDPASEVWLRELFAAFFEDEPRVTVDTSASTYYVYEFGKTSLFYHHGHKRKTADIDRVWVGRFREIFGRTQYSYGHTGHKHADELRTTLLGVKVEQHETLAAPDAYSANGGWLSGRSAKVITYHRMHGEVSRITLTPQMVTR